MLLDVFFSLFFVVVAAAVVVVVVVVVVVLFWVWPSLFAGFVRWFNLIQSLLSHPAIPSQSFFFYFLFSPQLFHQIPRRNIESFGLLHSSTHQLSNHPYSFSYLFSSCYI